MKNHSETDSRSANELFLELFITGDQDDSVTVEIPSIGYKEVFFLQGRTVKNIKLDPRAQIVSSEVIEEKRAVHITSKKPITVYGLNRRFQTTDTFLGLPTRVLGTSYRVLCYSVSDGLVAEFAIVATENNTNITIIPTANTTFNPANKPYTVKLNKGDVYQVFAKYETFSACDLTGSLIRSDKKIAVFSGHVCSYVPPKIFACNHLVEQMPPIPSWGKHFYIGKLQPRMNYTYRVVANEPNTKVFEDAQLIKVLNSGQFMERTVNRNIQVTSDKPVLVGEYSHGFKYGDSIGDPMVLLISPTQQFLQKYRFATPINGSWEHYINVVVPTNAIGSLILDGAPVDLHLFEKLGISRYSVGFIKIPYGTHVISCDQPFGMYSYGFGYGRDAFDAYGNMGGQSFLEYESAKDSLAPTVESKPGDKALTLIFRDDRIDDSGIRGLKVIENQKIELSNYKVEEGMPQLALNLKPTSSDEGGRLLLEVSDVSWNKTVVTVCYSINPQTDKYEFSISEGYTESCQFDPGIQVGVFGKFSAVIHSADFSSSGNVHAKGKFSNALGTGGYFGLYASRQIYDKLYISSRISFENYGGLLNAPDTSFSHYRNSDGTLTKLQESRDLTLNSLFLNLAFAGEWHWKDFIYLLGGLNFTIPLSDKIQYNKRIIFPEKFTYQNGTVDYTDATFPESIGSLNSLRVGVFGGVGFSYKIMLGFSAFAEATYTYHIGSIISDGDWFVQQISFAAGIKYKIFF